MSTASRVLILASLTIALALGLTATSTSAQDPASQTKSPAPLRMRVASNVPKAISQSSPAYPQEAIDKKVEGEVVLHVLIAGDGTVKEVSAMSGPEILSAAAVEAAKQWTYNQMRLNTSPVEQDTTVNLKFVLGPPPTVSINNKPPSHLLPNRASCGNSSGRNCPRLIQMRQRISAGCWRTRE